MGQPVSKTQQGVVPFENYQGPALGPPPMGPPPGLVTAQYNQSGGRLVAADDSFLDDEPPYLPQPQPLPRTARGNFGPPPRGMPRRFPFGGPPQDRSVVNGPGYASQLMAEEAPRYRSNPPQDPRQPNIKTVRTVINEPRGYQPPGQTTQSYQIQAQPQSYQVQPQGYQVQAQPQTYQVQAQPQVQQPAHVMYYDPKTGALSSAGQQYVAPSGSVGAVPQVVGYQQPQVLGFQAQPQVVGYQQPTQVMGYQQTAQPVMLAYPQQQQAQPIVVPGQLYTANGGVQQLG